MRRLATIAATSAAVLAFASSAAAGPVATSDGDYQRLGRVFPDPLASCGPSSGVCSPNAQGNVPAQTHIQIDELLNGLRYMNSKPEWQRYLEVLPLDGKLGNGSGTEPGNAMFPGNNLPFLEWDPKPEYQSAGLPQEDFSRLKSDMIVVRVTDENVPDDGKKRYALSLSIHGIERAGAEGGTRAIEDLVTAFTTRKGDRPVVNEKVKPGAPTFADVLQRTIIYFTYPNPDGWRRGSFTSDPASASFQRYNGNGVDLNRDWPDIGFAFRGYSALSEPETRSLHGFFSDLRRKTGARFAAANDLHGQPDADALSYTLLPHGRHDYAKDIRLREASKRINRSTFESIKWSARVQENDQPVCGGPSPGVPIADDCPKIYAQTWGTVYDTINYTVSGALSDWLDSAVGLESDGIDNEMSFSHLDRDVVFERQGEQLHVDGNKALIYAHLTEILDPPGGDFDAPGRKGYVPGSRIRREQRSFQPGPPEGSRAQKAITIQGTPAQTRFPFVVKPNGEMEDGAPIFNGGFRVDVTVANVGSQSSGTTTLDIQCRGCDEHPGVRESDQFITVARNYNQSSIYRQAGITAAVNRPQASKLDGGPVEWRAVVSSEAVAAKVEVIFTRDRATDDGATQGDLPPMLTGYDVANTDFFPDLNRYIPSAERKFRAIDPLRVLRGEQSLDDLTSLVLADDVLPGFPGRYAGEPDSPPAGPTGPTAGQQAGTVVPPRTYTGEQKDAWIAKLRAYVEGGGNLVLTDGATRGLGELLGDPELAGVQRPIYVGQIGFGRSSSESTLRDPLVTTPQNVDQLGSRFQTGLRRQTFEPTPLGFFVDASIGAGSRVGARQFDVSRVAFERAGGRMVAAGVSSRGTSANVLYDRVTLGEIRRGAGQVRILGALLPQPNNQEDHPLGLEPYATTYTGYILFRNLLEFGPRSVPGAGGGGDQGGGAGTAPGRRFLISRRSVRLSRRGSVRLRVSCRSSTRCRGTIRLQTAKRFRRGRQVRRIVLARRSFSVAARRRAVLRFRLSTGERRLIRRERRARVLAIANLRPAAGVASRRRQTVTTSFRLVRPRAAR